MVQFNKFEPNLDKSKQVKQRLFSSEKSIITSFCILVAVFSILLTLVIQTLAVHLWGGIVQGNWFSPNFKSISFVLLSILFGAIISYLLYFAVVIRKLFKGFWKSLEEE